MNRRGFTLLETMIAAILLATALVAVVPTLAWIVRERQSAERRQAALIEVGNLMERVTALPWSELAQGSPEVALSDETAGLLPEARLEVNVEADPEDDDARQIAIELSWMAGPDIPAAPVRLTAWVYRRGRGP